MIESSELSGAAQLPGEPLRHRNRRTRQAICAGALLAGSAALALVFVLIVIPAAGAAGGCGGG